MFNKWLIIFSHFPPSSWRILAEYWWRIKKHKLPTCRIFILNEPTQLKINIQLYVISLIKKLDPKILHHLNRVLQRLVLIHFSITKITSKKSYQKQSIINHKQWMGIKWLSCMLLWRYSWSIYNRNELDVWTVWIY